MNTSIKKTLCLAVAISSWALATGITQEKLVPLQTELPKQKLVGTPVAVKLPNLEPLLTQKPNLQIPEGSTNLALKKTVTGSDNAPIIGELNMITDGDKSPDEGSFAEFSPGTQWVQIDLAKSSSIYAILVWHYHLQQRAYHDVIVQVSDDADFLTGVTTVYNNDADNSSGKGVGKDRAYIETNIGKWIEVKGVKGRYVRLYSKGNTTNDMNHYIEVEVWGK